MTESENPLFYSVEEAAAKLGIGRNSAYNAVNRGEIPAIRIGKLLKIPRAALDRLLGTTQEAAAAPVMPQPPEFHRIRPIRKVLRQEPRVQVNLAVSVELNNKLVEAAEANGKTLSGEIRERLNRSFESGGRLNRSGEHKE